MRVGIEADGEVHRTIAFFVPSTPVQITAAEVRATAEAAGITPVVIDYDADSVLSEVDGIALDHAPECVVVIGRRTDAAIGLAVRTDRPLMRVASLSVPLLHHVVQALRAGSAIHRCVLRLQIDRRVVIATDQVVMSGGRLEVTRHSGHVSAVEEAGRRLLLRAEQPSSTRVMVQLDDAKGSAADEVKVQTSEPALVRANGWQRTFSAANVQVHPNPLRELVLGMPDRRRPTRDGPPL